MFLRLLLLLLLLLYFISCLFAATYVKKEDREAEKRLGKKRGYFNSKPWTYYGQGVDRRICRECSGICCNALNDLIGRLVEKGFLVPGAHSPTVSCCCLCSELCLIFTGLLECNKACNLEARVLAYRYVFVFFCW